jgi:uncharacterized protein (DUF433 family)
MAMARVRWEDHVTIDPDLHHGDPCITGTRIPVAIIIGSLADGMKDVEILKAYPQLKLEDIHAALASADEVMRQELLLSVTQCH